jgi:hypothetical protein
LHTSQLSSSLILCQADNKGEEDPSLALNVYQGPCLYMEAAEGGIPKTTNQSKGVVNLGKYQRLHIEDVNLRYFYDIVPTESEVSE